MPHLEVEVMLENHPHLFVVDTESVLESPQVGDSMTCKKCGHVGKIAKVSIPGRKQREDRPMDDKQQSIFKE